MSLGHSQTDTKNKMIGYVGHRREAYYKENFYFNGKFVDTAIYSLLKQDFPGLRG